MDNLVENFKKQLFNVMANNGQIDEIQFEIDYLEILDNLNSSYDVYRKYIGKVLNILEKTDNSALPYHLLFYYNLYNKTINLTQKEDLFDDILGIRYEVETVEKFILLFELVFSKGEAIRISDFQIDIENFSVSEKKQVICFLYDSLKQDSEKLDWDMLNVNTVSINLAFLRNFCLSISHLDLFYAAIDVFIDRLFTSEYYQVSRDICEEIIICSFKDGYSFYGFFIYFKSYSNQGNVEVAFFYGNLYLNSTLKYGCLINKKYFFDIIWQSLKFLRNCKFIDFALSIYENSPKIPEISDYQRHSLDHSYITCKLSRFDKDLPYFLVDYLDRERESILNEDTFGCIPWLITIYNIKRLKNIYNFENSGLESYQHLFESIVPSEMILKQFQTLFGDLNDIKNQLKSSLIKLGLTRYKSDFGYDNKNSSILARRILEIGFIEKDIESFLLAMLVKADYSVNLKPKVSLEVAPLKLDEISVDNFYKLYPDANKILFNLELSNFESVVLLLNSEENLYQLTFNQELFIFDKLSNWNFNNFMEWGRNVVDDFEFDTTKKDKNGVRSLFSEDYEHQSQDFIKQHKFPEIHNTANLENIYLVKDMVISHMPHNLFLNENRQFISLHSMVTNIISIEWLDSKLLCSNVNQLNGISIYIPVEGGDLTINMLYEKIRDVLLSFKVKTITSIQPTLPINSTINIISSHGSNNIATTHAIFPDDDHICFDLDSVVGDGKILILFICHSGSTKKYFFKDEIATLINKFLKNGYESVIAPFWQLHIDIPKIWLPTFLESLNSGRSVSKSVFQANLSVYQFFPTPTAWASMHLYGNPFYQIIDK